MFAIGALPVEFERVRGGPNSELRVVQLLTQREQPRLATTRGLLIRYVHRVTCALSQTRVLLLSGAPVNVTTSWVVYKVLLASLLQENFKSDLQTRWVHPPGILSISCAEVDQSHHTALSGAPIPLLDPILDI